MNFEVIWMFVAKDFLSIIGIIILIYVLFCIYKPLIFGTTVSTTIVTTSAPNSTQVPTKTTSAPNSTQVPVKTTSSPTS